MRYLITSHSEVCIFLIQPALDLSCIVSNVVIVLYVGKLQRGGKW